MINFLTNYMEELVFSCYDKTGNGSLNTTSFSTIYSYQLSLSRNWTLNFGIKASFVQKSLDWENAVWGDQIDPALGAVLPTNQPQEIMRFMQILTLVYYCLVKIYF